MPCSDPIIALLAPFRPLFTAPTWKKMLTLLRGTLLARGRRTVTAALWQTGHQQDPHFSAFHQALNRARWSPLEVSRQLLTLIRATFLQAGGTLDLVIDETLERRWGAQIRKRGHYRDSALSSRQRSVSSPGLRWIVLAVVVQVRLHAAAVGLAVSGCARHHSRREPAVGGAPQNRRHARPPTGQPAPALAAGGADQADGRPGLQHPGTGAALREASSHADCPLSPRLGYPPATAPAKQACPRTSPGFGQTLALGRTQLA